MSESVEIINHIDNIADLTAITTFSEFDQAFETEIKRVSVGFVRLGYLIKRARDTNILAGSSYRTVSEYAKAKYNLDKSAVSRFIAINDRFSVGGYSDKLAGDFGRYGLAKLQEMLLLPDSIIEELSPEMTRTDIQEIKKSYFSENQRTDIEVMLEDDPTPETVSSLAQKALFVYFRENTAAYEIVYNEVCRHRFAPKQEGAVTECLAPSGIMKERVRIDGVGTILITLHDDGFHFTNMRSAEKERLSEAELIKTFSLLFSPAYAKDKKTAWQQVYGRRYPDEATENKEADTCSGSEEDKQDSGEHVAAKQPKVPDDDQTPKLETTAANASKEDRVQEVPAQEAPKKKAPAQEALEQATLAKEALAKEASAEEAPAQNEATSNENPKPVQTCEAAAKPYRDIVFDEMAAVAKELIVHIKAKDIAAIDNTLKDISHMLDSIKQAEASHDIIGQMSFAELEQE